LSVVELVETRVVPLVELVETLGGPLIELVPVRARRDRVVPMVETSNDQRSQWFYDADEVRRDPSVTGRIISHYPGNSQPH
jgi:hypothetical protein